MLNSTVILDTSHMLLAIETLFKTDTLMLAPDYLSRLPMLQGGVLALSLFQIPAYSHFRTDLFLVHHKRTLNSLLQRGIANEISDAFRFDFGVKYNSPVETGSLQAQAQRLGLILTAVH